MRIWCMRQGAPTWCSFDNLEGWDGVEGKKEFQERGDICIPMTDSYKPTQYCKAIILQLNI